MCGIAAVARFDGQPVEERLLRSMRDTMEHRGPDDAGIRTDGSVGLAHRRLSIVDLSHAGHQPMCNEDGTIWLVFNGEIYNYVELAEELRQKGHHFSSHTDSETILHLYEELGERCVDRLTGMFGFALWDSRRRTLFVARDRLGIKPLCYYIDDRTFICASEAKAILADDSVPRAADRLAIADYLFAGFPLADRTAFAGIRQLLPGHTLTISLDDGTARMREYWDVVFRYDRQRSDDDVVAELAALLDDAVRIHCRSDAPLGCHLSGGLDSSTVTSLAARYRQPLKTFSIRFAEGGYYDETAYARAVASHAGAQYLETVPDSDDFSALLPMLLWHMEMPLPNAGGFSYYTVSRLAASHVKVSLTGHGGDEVFAGYPAQFRAAFGSADGFESAAAPAQVPAQAWPARIRRVLRSQGVAGIAQRVGRRLQRPRRTLEEQWVAMHCGPTPQENTLLAATWRRGLGGYSPVDDYLRTFRAAATDEVLDRCLYHDLRTYLPGLLYMEDRVSMAVSLESRVPLLDHRVVELMATVPPEQKVRGRTPKRLLREVAQGLLPENVSRRADKRGFPVPLDEWFSSHLRTFTNRILLDPRSLDRGVFDAAMLRRQEWTPSEAWSLVNVELWHRIFIDRDPEWTERIRMRELAGAL